MVAGQGNSINSSGLHSVCLGKNNFINGFSSLCLGENNIAQGNNSLALGTSANANNNGVFVFSDASSTSGYSSSDVNTFNIRASGGFNLDSINSDSKINFNVDGISKSSISCPVTGKDDLVISTTGKDIRLFSKFGKVNTNCDLKLGNFDYDYANVNFRSGSTLASGAVGNSTYGHSFKPRIGITINTLLIPSNLLSNNGGSQLRDVSIWENGVLASNFIFTPKTSSQSVNGFYSTEIDPFVCTSGVTYIIGCRLVLSDNIDDSNINNSAVIIGSNIADQDDLFSNVIGLYNPLPNNSGTRLPNTLTTGITPFIQFNFSTNGIGKSIECSDIVCDKITVGNPIVETESKIISTIDYSNLYPILMLADITEVDGGNNKCWGHTAIYRAGVQLKAGRLVSLRDASVNSDNTNLLEVEYLRTNNINETQHTIYPIGISQNNANAGQPVTICILGYTTAILEISNQTPERGSIILSGSSNTGKVRANLTGSNDQARVGFVAQSNSVSTNGAILIYYSGYFQPY
jgi:hypothetical protein